MSSIRKQSIYSSLFIYAGFIIGAINILKLFPDTRYFRTEEFGLTRLLLDVAILFSTTCTLGSLNITFKFFPFYRSYLPERKNDLPTITLILVLTGCILFSILVPMAQPFLLRKFGSRSPLFLDYFYLIYPFTISLAFFNLMEAYAWSLQRTVLTNFLKEFLSRIITTALILLFMWKIIPTFKIFVNIYVYIYGALALSLFLLMLKKGEFPIKFSKSSVTRRLSGKMFVFGFSFFLSSILNILAKTNDTIIIASQSKGGLVDTAIFVIATYLVTLMDVPQRSLISAATAQISIAWKERDMEKIGRLYSKTALNLLIAAIAILGTLLLNGKNIVHYLGPTYGPIPQLLVLLGLTRLIDLGTGLNAQILVLSRYWKVDLITNLLFVVASIIFNYFLTIRMGVMGPAWGGLMAIIIFNTLRFIFLWSFFRLQPFSSKNLKAFLLGIVIFLFINLIPQIGNVFIDVAIRSFLFLGMYTTAILRLHVSEDINQVFLSIRSRVRL
jgi:O-antigen/teichoic acid export membrane protein